LPASKEPELDKGRFLRIGFFPLKFRSAYRTFTNDGHHEPYRGYMPSARSNKERQKRKKRTNIVVKRAGNRPCSGGVRLSLAKLRDGRTPVRWPVAEVTKRPNLEIGPYSFMAINVGIALRVGPYMDSAATILVLG